MTIPALWAWVQAHALAAWPVLTAILILGFRTRTPAEWVALGERSPRAQGFIRFLRGAGFDPAKALAGAVQFVTGRAPPSIMALVATATPEPAALAQQLYEAYGDRVGWHSVTGAQMPAWGDLPEHIRDAWGASAGAAIEAMTWSPAAEAPAEIARPTTAPPRPSGQSGSATVGALVVLAALALAVCAMLQGCGPAREAALRVTPGAPQPVGCVEGSQRCAPAPQICSASGRWWPVLPPTPDGRPRVCTGECRVEDGVAYCAPERPVVMP